jgi:hypothetical protein
MTLKVNQENMQVTSRFGLKSLFDGYLITSKILCDGYVMGSTQTKAKSLITNDFLCDGYVIDEQILFDVNLIKQKK